MLKLASIITFSDDDKEVRLDTFETEEAMAVFRSILNKTYGRSNVEASVLFDTPEEEE